MSDVILPGHEDDHEAQVLNVIHTQAEEGNHPVQRVLNECFWGDYNYDFPELLARINDRSDDLSLFISETTAYRDEVRVIQERLRAGTVTFQTTADIRGQTAGRFCQRSCICWTI